jgi:hypothetical protein
MSATREVQPVRHAKLFTLALALALVPATAAMIVSAATPSTTKVVFKRDRKRHNRIRLG